MNKLEKSLNQAVMTTFGNMAFIDAVPLPEVPQELTFSHILCIALSEPRAGMIALYLPYDCKRLIVENIYGNDWNALTPTEIDDCLLELLNVLAGNFLNAHHPAGTRVQISFPELLFDAQEIERIEDRQEFFFDAEGNPFKVAIHY